MELRQLQYFVEVARREHMTRASEKLHVAQSAISRQIGQLEEELGVQLFYREGRNVKVTPIGRLFLARVENALLQLDKAKQEVEEFLDPEAGEIRIGFPHSLAAYALPSIVSAFRLEHPNVKFVLRQGTVQHLKQDLIAGEIDLAFVSPVPTEHPELEGHVLFTEEMVAILPHSHPLAGSTSIRLRQLEEDPFIVFREGYTLRTIVMDACQQAGFIPKIAFEGEETDTIRGLVAASLGVALLPAIALEETAPIQPVKVPISEPRITRTVGFVQSKSRKLVPSARVFKSFLWEFYRSKS